MNIHPAKSIYGANLDIHEYASHWYLLYEYKYVKFSVSPFIIR